MTYVILICLSQELRTKNREIADRFLAFQVSTYDQRLKHFPLSLADRTNIGRVFTKTDVATLLTVPQSLLDLRRFFGSYFRHCRRFLQRCLRSRTRRVGSSLFFLRPTLRNRVNRRFAFMQVLSHEKCAVTASKFLYVWVSIIARADYISVQLKIP